MILEIPLSTVGIARAATTFYSASAIDNVSSTTGGLTVEVFGNDYLVRLNEIRGDGSKGAVKG